MNRKVYRSIVFLACCAMGFAGNAYSAASSPNLYEMAGRGVKITYSSTSLTGEPQLTYATSKQTLTFRGADVREENTAIGHLITVTTAFQVDVNYTTLSVLIPDIHLQTGPEKFSTVGFITTHKTPFILPSALQGPVQTYQTLALHGTASLVYYLLPGTGISGTVSVNTCAGTPPPAGCVYPFSDAPIEVLDANNLVIAKTTANVDGLFSVNTAPGNYTVHVVTNGLFPACPDTPVGVAGSGTAVVDIMCTAIK